MPYPHSSGPKKAYKEIMGIREAKKEGGKSFWSRIGIAMENKDGSLQLYFDYFPADPTTTRIQIRDPRPREDGAPARATAAAEPDRDIDF